MSAPSAIAALPEWVSEIRPHQQVAVDEIVDAFDRVKVVYLDGPTGTGKTLIAELVRRRLAVKALYVCSDKQLQDQFAGDFDYAKVLKGRANYPTEVGPDSITCDDCTFTQESGCMWCESKNSCPYQVAKNEALAADLAVINTSYLLTEANGPGEFSSREFVILDEADTLEGSLLNHVEYVVPGWVWKALRLTEPRKGVHKTTLVKWLIDTAADARDHLQVRGGFLEVKEKKRWRMFIADTERVIRELEKDIALAARAREAGGEGDDADTETGGRWLRDYDTKTFKMTPVMVASYGPKMIWRHARKFLIMSATLISPEQMSDELGMPFDFETVTVPMTFPVENRPIYLAGIANMTYNADDAEYDKLATAVCNIAELHPHDRILVHTVSHRLTRRLADMLIPRIPGRPVVTYTDGRDKMDALERYRRTPGAILLGASLKRGVDLRDDDCRVVVIAKVPYPSMGDKRVSARIRLPGGQAWYAVAVIRDIVQMTGRGVRSADDYAVTYILDQQFMRNTWRRSKALFPQWWRDAVDPSFNPRQLLRAY